MSIAQKYAHVRNIACGAFGKVSEVEDNVTKKRFALKKMVGQVDRITHMKEIVIMTKLKHKNIIQYYDYEFDDDFTRIIMELCPHSLRYLIDIKNKHFNRQKGQLTITEVEYKINLRVIKEICAAVEYMHSHNIAHRDLKPENLLVSDGSDGTFIKLCDFGLSKHMLGSTHSSCVGSLHYIAPEVMAGEHYNVKADVYSLAVIVLELVGFVFRKGFVWDNWVKWFDTMPRYSYKNQDLKLAMDNLIDLAKSCIMVEADKHPTRISSTEFAAELNQLSEINVINISNEETDNFDINTDILSKIYQAESVQTLAESDKSELATNESDENINVNLNELVDDFLQDHKVEIDEFVNENHLDPVENMTEQAKIIVHTYCNEIADSIEERLKDHLASIEGKMKEFKDNFFMSFEAELANKLDEILRSRIENLQIISPPLTSTTIVGTNNQQADSIQQDELYPLTSDPHGFCLIFSYEEYEVLPERRGASCDRETLLQTFTMLDYQVIIFQDLTRESTLNTIHEYSKHQDLRQHDSLIIFILGHGEQQHFITSDNCGISFEEVIAKFNNINCPFMIGKPKLIFFNCCRGEVLDHGINISDNDEEDNHQSDARPLSNFDTRLSEPTVPTISDFMIAYSTIDGYASWRNMKEGTWFVNSITDVLNKDFMDKELSSVLVKASNVISGRVANGTYKQAMEFGFRGFKRLFYFRRKQKAITL